MTGTPGVMVGVSKGGPEAEDGRVENHIVVGREESGELFSSHTLIDEDPYAAEVRPGTDLFKAINERFQLGQEEQPIEAALRWLYNVAHFNGRRRQAAIEFREREEARRPRYIGGAS